MPNHADEFCQENGSEMTFVRLSDSPDGGWACSECGEEFPPGLKPGDPVLHQGEHLFVEENYDNGHLSLRTPWGRLHVMADSVTPCPSSSGRSERISFEPVPPESPRIRSSEPQFVGAGMVRSSLRSVPASSTTSATSWSKPSSPRTCTWYLPAVRPARMKVPLVPE